MLCFTHLTLHNPHPTPLPISILSPPPTITGLPSTQQIHSTVFLTRTIPPQASATIPIESTVFAVASSTLLPPAAILLDSPAILPTRSDIFGPLYLGATSPPSLGSTALLRTFEDGFLFFDRTRYARDVATPGAFAIEARNDIPPGAIGWVGLARKLGPPEYDIHEVAVWEAGPGDRVEVVPTMEVWVVAGGEWETGEIVEMDMVGKRAVVRVPAEETVARELTFGADGEWV